MKANTIFAISITTLCVMVFGDLMLFPSVSSGLSGAKFAGAKIQLSQMSSAVSLFRSNYGHYPKIFDESGLIKLGEGNNSVLFMEALAAHNVQFEKVKKHGNDKGIRFYEFSKIELNQNNKIIDIYGNTNITIVIDTNRDNSIDLPEEAGGVTILGSVHAYSHYDDGAMAASTWDSELEKNKRDEKKSIIMRSVISILFTAFVIWSVIYANLHIAVALLISPIFFIFGIYVSVWDNPVFGVVTLFAIWSLSIPTLMKKAKPKASKITLLVSATLGCLVSILFPIIG